MQHPQTSKDAYLAELVSSGAITVQDAEDNGDCYYSMYAMQVDAFMHGIERRLGWWRFAWVFACTLCFISGYYIGTQ